MSDFINKVITVALIFVMLVLGPLIKSYQTSEMIAKRMILNEVTQFIDKVKDTANISEEDLNKLYLACNSYGLSVDVDVKRLIRTAVTKDGNAKTVYYAVDSIDELQNMNPGDTIKISVKSVSISPGRKLVYNVLKIDEGPFEFSLAGAVG